MSEQKQLEQMQAYSFQQFKQIQKMMIQMQKSQQWSFNNIQQEIEQIHHTIERDEQKEQNITMDLANNLGQLNFYNHMNQQMVRNLNSTNSSSLDLTCTNAFFCEAAGKCSQVSICRSNDTCSLIQKCDAKGGNCTNQQVCQKGSLQLV